MVKERQRKVKIPWAPFFVDRRELLNTTLKYFIIAMSIFLGIELFFIVLNVPSEVRWVYKIIGILAMGVGLGFYLRKRFSNVS